MPQPDLITSAIAATQLGIDRTTLTRWVRNGRLSPAIVLPGKTGAYLFRRSDIEDLANAAAK